MFDRFYQMFSNDIGIDLGTANTLVYLRGHGIVINEPSIVAVNTKTGRIVAVGAPAKEMLGRTPGHIRAVRPLVEGVVSDFEVTQEMLTYLVSKVEKISNKLFRPRVVVGIPSGITSVERRAVYDATKHAGARDVYIIEEPMAAAIGMRLPVFDPIGSMVIDIGGGTTDIAVLSLGGIVQSKNVKVAGDKLNQDIVVYLKEEFKLLIGEKTAERIKIEIGSAVEGESLEVTIKGRDLITGLPREVVMTDSDVRHAISQSLMSLVESVKGVLETTPPELLADVMKNGIFLTGGGALLRGLTELLESVIKIPVHITDDPLSTFARGAGIVLEDIEKHREVLVGDEDDVGVPQ
jgi:rod shape-determining protein MreB and related proteins